MEPEPTPDELVAIYEKTLMDQQRGLLIDTLEQQGKLRAVKDTSPEVIGECLSRLSVPSVVEIMGFWEILDDFRLIPAATTTAPHPGLDALTTVLHKETMTDTTDKTKMGYMHPEHQVALISREFGNEAMKELSRDGWNCLRNRFADRLQYPVDEMTLAFERGISRTAAGEMFSMSASELNAEFSRLGFSRELRAATVLVFLQTALSDALPELKAALEMSSGYDEAALHFSYRDMTPEEAVVNGVGSGAEFVFFTANRLLDGVERVLGGGRDIADHPQVGELIDNHEAFLAPFTNWSLMSFSVFQGYLRESINAVNIIPAFQEIVKRTFPDGALSEFCDLQVKSPAFKRYRSDMFCVHRLGESESDIAGYRQDIDLNGINNHDIHGIMNPSIRFGCPGNYFENTIPWFLNAYKQLVLGIFPDEVQ